jgi:hypothetical protein
MASAVPYPYPIAFYAAAYDGVCLMALEANVAVAALTGADLLAS